jgi:phosphinothricin acetyltransferase
MPPTEPTASVRAMDAGDWPAVRAIYADGIAGGQATFETEPPSWEDFDAGRHPHLRLVAADDRGTVLGWAAASPTSARAVYAGVAEHSVYVATAARGRGVGRLLLGALVDVAEAAGVWTLQSGIFPENAASLALHARLGFRVVGRRERVARHHGTWRDVLLVERRSRVVGVEPSETQASKSRTTVGVVGTDWQASTKPASSSDCSRA